MKILAILLAVCCISIAAPAWAATVTASVPGVVQVSGSVTVSISTTLSLNNDWWNGLSVDGVDTGLNDGVTYQQIPWNSTTVVNGAHTLTVIAHQKNTGTVEGT